MEDLEEIMDLIAGCKVDFNRDEFYLYLTKEVGKFDQFGDSDEEVDAFDLAYMSIRNVAIDVYAASLKNYYTFDEEQYLKINKEKGLIQVLRKPK